MHKVIFIRHGKTYGNTLGRYIGVTDEPLCQEGRKELETFKYPLADQIYVSPMKRCMETAELLYAGAKFRILEEFRECDFGEFENKNYRELEGNAAYQAWIDSEGKMPFPGGEDSAGFRARCREGFRKVAKEILNLQQGSDLDQRLDTCTALVVHGGTIMSILEAFSDPHKDFYEWQIKNGRYLEFGLDEELWRSAGQIRLYQIRKGEETI